MDQSVWVIFTGRRIQLFAEDKCIIEGQEKLHVSDHHVNFAQAILRTQF